MNNYQTIFKNQLEETSPLTKEQIEQNDIKITFGITEDMKSKRIEENLKTFGFQKAFLYFEK